MQRALDYQIGAWACGDPPFEVVARIRGVQWIQSLLEAPPDLKGYDRIVEKGGKSLLVRFKANKEQGPIRWLLQFGCCAEVLEPKALRDRFREELEATLKIYDS
jgi:predicted DNA-binding transcriptional regulator YafY